MKWIKKFESIETEYKDYFQELVDNWYVGISDEEGKIDYFLIVSTDNIDGFPSIRDLNRSWVTAPKSILEQCVISFKSIDFDKYCKFMIDLHRCLNHFISSHGDHLSFMEIFQDENSIIWIKFKKLG
jgi:hypothetical protein